LFFAFVSDYNRILILFVSISLNVTLTGVPSRRNEIRSIWRFYSLSFFK